MSDYTNNKITDQDLVIAIKRHDQAAFKELLNRYNINTSKVYAYWNSIISF
jgi:hypothetical protein